MFSSVRTVATPAVCCTTALMWMGITLRFSKSPKARTHNFYNNNIWSFQKKVSFKYIFPFYIISEAASDGMADGVKMNGSVNGFGSLAGSAPMSPLSSSLSSILQQPEESIPFVPLSPALLNDEYMLSLGDEQGISDLFDSCDLDTLALDDLLRIWAIPEASRTWFQVSWPVVLSSWMKSRLTRLMGRKSGDELQTEFPHHIWHSVYAWIFRFTASGSKVSLVSYCTDGFLYPDNVILKLFLVWWVAWIVWLVCKCYTGFCDGQPLRIMQKVHNFLKNRVFLYS